MSCSNECAFPTSTSSAPGISTAENVGLLELNSTTSSAAVTNIMNQDGMELLCMDLSSMELSLNGSFCDDLTEVNERINSGKSESGLESCELENQQNQNDFKEPRNIIEHVRVPSSAHVAEIVGRQGYKIRSLRAKTNTYINTPLRGEEPIFFIRGTKSEVAIAQQEILTAAEHFSKIRASTSSVSCRKGRIPRKPAKIPPMSPILPKPTPSPVPATLANKLNAKSQITIFVNVPQNLVGLVVGLRGVTIKRIQEQTHTFILTPTREMDPYFEVTGLPENVQLAKREIEDVIENAVNPGGASQKSAPVPVSGRRNETGSPQSPSSQPNHWKVASHEELLATLNVYGLKGIEERHGVNLGYGIVKKSSEDVIDPYLFNENDGPLIDPIDLMSTNPREGGLLWGFDLGEDRGPWTRPAKSTGI